MKSILPGRPQSARQAVCTVNWDGLRLVTYISGNTVVIFNGRREILQSILLDDAKSLHCLIINDRSGHLAVSDDETTYLYRPFGRDYGDLRWTRTGVISHQTEGFIRHLSWGIDDELLVAGSRLTLWNLSNETRPQTIWASNTSSDVSIASFSPDASLIASVGQHDRMVKIWRRLSYEQDSTRFDVSYLPHPCAVTNLLWRSFWHQEQSLDNLLYTFCADNYVRVWAHTEQHANQIMQQVIIIDTNTSIQPRRLSIGSVSKNRFVFMLESKDLARAAERSLQSSRNTTDHALENFIQIVNRSPEICIVLDGLGHMSAWGIENAALRNKQDPEKFNVALVDGIDVHLPSGRAVDDYIKIHAFANNDASASLCILVQSYSGQIDWYEGSFVEFFDTASRAQRTRLLSCWSGHDTPLERVIAREDGLGFISIDETNNVILWSKTANEALVRHSEICLDDMTIDAKWLYDRGLLLCLHNENLSVWEVANMRARKIQVIHLSSSEPALLCILGETLQDDDSVGVAVTFENRKIEFFRVREAGAKTADSKKDFGTIEQVLFASMSDVGKDDVIIFSIDRDSASHGGKLSALSDQGNITSIEIAGKASLTVQATFNTYVRASNIFASTVDHIHAFAHADYRTLSIWNSAQGVCEFERTFTDLDTIQGIGWHYTQNGQLMLAIRFPHNVAIIGKRQYKSQTHDAAWELLQIIQTRQDTTLPIETLCWLQPCQIVLGAGSQILVYDVERCQSPSKDNAKASQGGKLDARAYLEGVNCHLAAFDPDLLGCLLENGQFSIASDLLRALHEELRFLVQGEKIDHNLNGALAARLISREDKILSNGSNGMSNGNSLINEHNLEDILGQLQENISRISKVQMPPQKQKRLQLLIQIYPQLLENRKSMDSHALTYLYHFLLSTLGIDSIQQLPALPISAVTHASLSQTQEALTHFVLQELERRSIKFSWHNARSLGVFMYTSDVETIKTHFESVAKAEYNRNPEDRNPVDCSLHYLALGKKAILQSLWRRTVGIKEKDNTLKLLARDFKDPKAKATALKNAYALLSRRRFEYAAAFFLLGSSLGDAVNVCVNQLHDIQLGIAITRVWTGDAIEQDRVIKNLIQKDLPKLALGSHEARWWSIWGRLYQDDLVGALRYIVSPIDQAFMKRLLEQRQTETEGERRRNTPLALYNYTANEPNLLVELYMDLREKLAEQGLWTEENSLPKEEWTFVMRCALWYTRAGMDILALSLVANWRFIPWQKKVVSRQTERSQEVPTIPQVQRSALDDWLIPDVEEKGSTKVKSVARPDVTKDAYKAKAKPPPTQFIEPSADSLLDSFGF